VAANASTTMNVKTHLAVAHSASMELALFLLPSVAAIALTMRNVQVQKMVATFVMAELALFIVLLCVVVSAFTTMDAKVH
jgi:hypothetical protein